MIETLRQLPELPRSPRPIVVIGAGGVVREAHLPAYKLAGFRVHSLFDLDQERAQKLALETGIVNVPASVRETVASAPEDAVFDLAIPGSAILDVLRELPYGAPVLIQKPMGENLEGAKAILDLCHANDLVAAVNFQMRWAPYVHLAREVIDRGLIGELQDIEVRLLVATPWHLWDFLNDIPRMELLYHSIHYIDTIRSFCGEPEGVYAKTIGHPSMPRIRQVRSTVVLDYGEHVRATITSNHVHDFGEKYQESTIKWEGTEGAIRATMGLNLDYPRGKPDTFEIYTQASGEWQSIPLQGSWFPHAFIGPMATLMRFVEGSVDRMPTSVDEAYKTMAVVEAAYASSAHGATPIPTLP